MRLRYNLAPCKTILPHFYLVLQSAMVEIDRLTAVNSNLSGNPNVGYGFAAGDIDDMGNRVVTGAICPVAEIDGNDIGSLAGLQGAGAGVQA